MEFNPTAIKLIIGLGNPDKKYRNTYHNAGHAFVDYLKRQGTMDKGGVLQSDVYMNESGKFVAKEIKKRGLKPEQLLIAHDDSDIEIGKYKLSFNRGAAGHHGIESIIRALGTKNFWRLRIGIRQGTKGNGQGIRMKARDFVLKKVSAEDKKILETTFGSIKKILLRDRTLL